MTRKLQDKAMLVHLQIRRWSARKHDRRISAEVARRHNTDEDAGRYNKQLLAKQHLEDVYLTSNRVRRFHYEKTLPWSDTGERILPAALHPEYTKELRELKTKFEHEVSAFVAAYPQLIQEARFHLQGLFNPDDYPSAEEIAEKFGISPEVLSTVKNLAEQFGLGELFTGENVEKVLNVAQKHGLTEFMTPENLQMAQQFGQQMMQQYGSQMSQVFAQAKDNPMAALDMVSSMIPQQYRGQAMSVINGTIKPFVRDLVKELE